MRIVIAGSGRVGSDLALRLADLGHDVSVVDSDESAFLRLGTTFNGTTHGGSAYDVDVLRDAGIAEADAFVAVTGSDNTNLMAVQLATQVFGVPETLARLDDPLRAVSYRALGVRYVAAAQLISKVIQEEVLDRGFRYHVTFAGGSTEILEFTLGPAANQLPIAALEAEDAVRIAAVRRGERTFIPGPDFALREGDLVVAAAKTAARDRIRRYVAEEH